MDRLRRGGRARRGLAVFASALVLLSLGAGVHHQIVTRHAVCAVHGETVEVREAPGADPFQSGIDALEDHAASEEHGHCGLVAHRRSALSVVEPAASLSHAPSASSQRGPSTDVPPHRPCAPLELAPKSSPPVA